MICESQIWNKDQFKIRAYISWHYISFGGKDQAFSFSFPFLAMCVRPGPFWSQFVGKVCRTSESILSFPSCYSTFNQIEKKEENYNFRLALSRGNISQKRKHKKLDKEFPTRDVGYIHHGNIIQGSILWTPFEQISKGGKIYFPNVHLSLTKIW